LTNDNRIAVVGVSEVRATPGMTQRMLASEAARRAVADAGLQLNDIDGALDLRRTGGGGDRGTYSDTFTRFLGMRGVQFYYTVGRGGALAGIATTTATGFLDRGLANYVVCVGAVDDYTKAQEARQKGFRGMSHVEKEGYWGKPLGDLRAASHHSWMAAKHMSKYGTTSEQLGAISVAQRAWAQLNPEATMYGRPITVQDHQDSPWVVEPYHRLDCSLISDGAIAFVLTTAERAKDLKQKPVYVSGQGYGEVAADLWWEKNNLSTMAVEPAKKKAFAQAGITVDDIDTAQLYDCFTGEVLIQLEDYGWAEKGKGGEFVASGATAPGGGGIPVNTGGGLLSNWHLGDLVGYSEAVLQLRGEAGERQVPNAKVALTTGHGGELVSPSMCSIHTSTILTAE
jgi:acetyl-CoA acetyltransferase